MREDTIAAISTAYGEGGIGIIRISGEEALPIAAELFKPALTPNVMTYGHIKDGEETIDEVMVCYFKAPKSYTAEDVVEIHCHGSVVSLRKILSLVLRHGARMAEPGEFTERAFLNGRLDLAQAEAVIDLIKAKSDKTFELALNNLEGGFSSKIRKIRAKIVDILVSLTVNIDYPDEDIEILTYDKLKASLHEVKAEVEKILKTSGTGRIIREGLKVSIIGKPNVGKSSLMNALLSEDRAIVTEIPGTTRDIIEESVNIRKIPVTLIDTAGIRETEDIVEKIGIEKSKEAFNHADLVIFMLDSSRPLEAEDRQIMEIIGDRRAICLLNKTDLGEVVKKTDIMKLIPNSVIIETAISAGMGTDLLCDEIEKLVYGGEVRQEDSLIVTNVRHEKLLEETLKSIEDALKMTENMEALEFLEIDVSNAYAALGKIIGEEVEEDIINEVFRRFCLGK